MTTCQCIFHLFLLAFSLPPSSYFTFIFSGQSHQRLSLSLSHSQSISPASTVFFI